MSSLNPTSALERVRTLETHLDALLIELENLPPEPSPARWTDIRYQLEEAAARIARARRTLNAATRPD